MEDRAPLWMCNRIKDTKTETAAAAVIQAPPPPTITPSPVNLHRDLSCAAVTEIGEISELSCHLAPHTFTTILDSGTTSHLIKDHRYLFNFAHKDCPPVKTANQGNLMTTGRGRCIVELALGDSTYCLILMDCLHAPNALLNLLSVSRMLQKGWDCDFKGSSSPSGPYCHLSYKGKIPGNSPLTDNLCYLNVRFLHPDEINSSTIIYKEMSILAGHETSAYTKVPTTWDTWHARMGHPGGESVKRLPLIAIGVSVNSNRPLYHCEACIIVKYPCKP